MKKIISVMLVLLSCSLWGEEKKINLGEALNLAYKNNYDYQNVKIDQENTKLQVKESYKEAMPKIDYRGGYNATGNDHEMNLVGGGKSNQRTNHKVGVTQPIYNGGIIMAGLNIANSSEELAGYTLLKSKSDLKLDVIDNYLIILAQLEAIKVYESSLKEVTTALNQAERKYELDIISKSDYLPLKTKVIATDSDLIESKNMVIISKIQLKNLIGIPVGEDIEIANVKNEKYDLSLIDLEGDVSNALLNNKDSKITKLKTHITEEMEKISRADLLPKINARFDYNAEDRLIKDSMDDWYWTAGIEVNWRLFDFGKTWDSYSRSKNETKKAKNDERKALDNLEVKIRSNYIELIKQNGVLETKIAELEATQENYNLQKKKYNEGIISITDYLIYETQLNNNKLSLISTRLDYYYAYEKYLEDLI